MTGRPLVPDGYGVSAAGAYLDWDTVRARLVDAVNYWLSTTRPDGRPHSVPRWGVWIDEMFWYDGSPQTRHALNLGQNASCVLHLESGSAATIVEGVSRPADPVTGSAGERLSEEFCRKYRELGYAPTAESWAGPDAGGLLVLRPLKVMAWSDFPADLTRFEFD